MTFSLYGIRDFRVEYLTDSGWVTVPNGEVTGNDKVWRKFTFPAVTTTKIRVYVTAGEAARSRIVEVEAYEGSPQESSSNIKWMVTDQLGTPRMVADKSGSLSGIRRHDYLPFGEELAAVSGARMVQRGYLADAVRQKFTGKERDNETGLDYFGARYYSTSQGRFTSSDPLLRSGRQVIPQSWNRYAYVLNNPLRHIDPDGLVDEDISEQGNQQRRQVIDIRDSKVINQRLSEIRREARPLAPGEAPVPTKVEYIVGEQITLKNAIVQGPDFPPVGIAEGYMRTVAVAVLDQKGNIISDPANMTLTERVKPVSEDAKTLEKEGKLITSNEQAVSQQPNGVFYDAQIRVQGAKNLDLQTTQDATIKSGKKGLFRIEGTQIRQNDSTKTTTITQGNVRRFF
jgi:RHS repeat-associated protein